MGLNQLTRLGGKNYKPDWSPDGQWIAFFNRPIPESQFDLMIISFDGNQVKSSLVDGMVSKFLLYQKWC